jgi:aspartate/methionine/tyrosine aminotransferase
MNLEVFEMERFQSEWENQVQFNLTESGVHPMSLADLLDPSEIAELTHLPLVYVQTNGTPALRDAIANLYPGAASANVVVTNGGAEANFIAIWRLVEPGDEVILMMPNYMQIWGIVRALGGTVVPWWLHEDRAWAPDVEELQRLVTSRTRAIVVCNPNNPTGAVLSEDGMSAIATLAGQRGVWLLADEIYRGAERDGIETPSFWGSHDRIIVTCGLSKAYGLPGLRLGWAVGPAPTVHELWARKDYLTIAPGALSDFAARRAVEPGIRPRILARTREIINAGYDVVDRWIRRHEPVVRIVPPRAGAVAYVKYSWPIGSTRLMERLRDEQGVLVVPGDQFGMDGYLRIGLGGQRQELEAGLERIDQVVASLAVARAGSLS